MDPQFFKRLVDQQRPEYFWIGCSDSRVPATEIVDLDPGEMFVHRNVANLAAARDPNFSAALFFAVETLRVAHVIVVGHYGCGGVRAAARPGTEDAVGRWLAPLRALRWRHRRMLISLNDESARDDMLCELNIVEQVDCLSRNPIILNAWHSGKNLALHGLIYGIADGLLTSVCPPITTPAKRSRRSSVSADPDDVAEHFEP